MSTKLSSASLLDTGENRVVSKDCSVLFVEVSTLGELCLGGIHIRYETIYSDWV